MIGMTIEGVLADRLPVGQALPIREGIALYRAFIDSGNTVALFTHDVERSKVEWWLEQNSLTGFVNLYLGKQVPPRLGSTSYGLFITAHEDVARGARGLGVSSLLFSRGRLLKTTDDPRSWAQISG